MPEDKVGHETRPPLSTVQSDSIVSKDLQRTSSTNSKSSTKSGSLFVARLRRDSPNEETTQQQTTSSIEILPFRRSKSEGNPNGAVHQRTTFRPQSESLSSDWRNRSESLVLFNNPTLPSASEPIPEPIDLESVKIGDFVFLNHSSKLEQYIERSALHHPSVIAQLNVQQRRLFLLTATTFGGSKDNPTKLGPQIYNEKTYFSIAPAPPTDNMVLLNYEHPEMTVRHAAWLCVSKLYEVTETDTTYVHFRKGDRLDATSLELVLHALAKNCATLEVWKIGGGGVPERGSEVFHNAKMVEDLKKGKNASEGSSNLLSRLAILPRSMANGPQTSRLWRSRSQRKDDVEDSTPE